MLRRYQVMMSTGKDTREWGHGCSSLDDESAARAESLLQANKAQAMSTSVAAMFGAIAGASPIRRTAQPHLWIPDGPGTIWDSETRRFVTDPTFQPITDTERADREAVLADCAAQRGQ